MDSLQGQLLLASPQLLDPNFAKSVVLLVQHDENGALGLVLNRPLETTLGEALAKAGEGGAAHDEPLYHGGPCEGPLMVLHKHEPSSQVKVLDGLYFSTEREEVEWLLSHYDGPIRFFAGYSGWGAGQLEGELAAGGWTVMQATAGVAFEEADNLWQSLRARLTLGDKINPRIVPEDPSMN